MKALIFTILFVLPTSCYCGEWFPFSKDYKPLLNSNHFNESAVENLLWTHITKNSDRDFEPKKFYNYQYQVLGNNIYKVNAFCNALGAANISENYIVVDDGGSCYFEIEYNSSTKIFSKLYVNGEA